MPESTRSSDPTESARHLDDSVRVVVLAGGIGSRFWPVSTRARPKQLLPLAGPDPLILETVRRARRLVPGEHVRILAGEHLAAPFRTVLDGFPESGYWIEPRARGTGPVLVWAAWRIVREDADAVMVSLHADHRIEPPAAFAESVAAAVEVARRDELLVTIGVPPTRVDTGYGHIEPGAPIVVSGGARAFRITTFHEKPNPEDARRYTEAGCLWNTGIFVWKASTLLEEIERHAPEIHDELHRLEESDRAFFDAVGVSVIDRVAMERSERVGVVEATFEWDDVGSWEALARTRAADGDGNVVVGEGRVVDGRGNIVFAEGGDVVLYGTDDLVVVRSGSKTLVTPRERAPELKALLESLETDAT